MKMLRLVFALLSAAMLSSCLDTEEKIELNADNSGNYSVTVDLARMLKMAGSMGAGKSDTGKIKEKKDTTVYIKDFINDADNLTDAEKALYKNAVIHVNLDEEKNEMKILMSAPFQNMAALTEIKNNLFTVMNKLKALEKATDEREKSDNDSDDLKMGTKSVNPLGEQFNFVAKDGRISNTINNIDSFKHLVATDSTLSMMSQMTAMMGDFNYRTIIVLPKAVKKYNGPGSTVSADKKTVTFVTTLTDMMEHPEKVSYQVEY